MLDLYSDYVVVRDRKVEAIQQFQVPVRDFSTFYGPLETSKTSEATGSSGWPTNGSGPSRQNPGAEEWSLGRS